MGRKKLNRTREELLKQQRCRAKRYYHNNKEKCNLKSMKRYWSKKELLPKRFSTCKMIEKLKFVRGDEYDYSHSIYKNSTEKIEIICKIHGPFWQYIYDHLKGSGCPKCKKVSIPTTDEFIEKSSLIHENEYDYSKIKYKNSKTKIEIICKIHGPFWQLPYNHLKGRGCPLCGIENQRYTINEFIDISSKIHENNYDYSQSKYINVFSKIKIVCPIHGSFLQTPHAHLNGQGCPKCNSIISEPEIEFLNYLQIPDTKENRQVKILRKKVDGFDPSKNTVYEFLGDYWHGNPQKFNINDTHPITQTTYGYLYEKTMERFQKIKKLGYTIKYIWEHDWKNWYKTKTGNIPLQEY
jgi:hypothetical protein